MMKKKILWVILFSVFLSIGSSIHAAQFDVRLNVGAELFRHLQGRNLLGMGGLAGGEIRYPVRNTSVGLGVEYQIPRVGFSELFNYIPVYGLVSYHVDVVKANLIMRLGYNFFKGEDHSGYYDYYYEDHYEGGLYYCFGIDRIMTKHVSLGVHYAVCAGQNNIPKVRTLDIKYKKMDVVLGISF